MAKRILKKTKAIQRAFAKQLLQLVTSGFGLVAALAWNEVIKEVVESYIKPVLGESSGVVSLLIYAILITMLAVIVTYNLSRISRSG